ncbi:unnamed protein product, partial [Prorocentrum cordatum]
MAEALCGVRYDVAEAAAPPIRRAAAFSDSTLKFLYPGVAGLMNRESTEVRAHANPIDKLTVLERCASTGCIRFPLFDSAAVQLRDLPCERAPTLIAIRYGMIDPAPDGARAVWRGPATRIMKALTSFLRWALDRASAAELRRAAAGPRQGSRPAGPGAVLGGDLLAWRAPCKKRVPGASGIAPMSAAAPPFVQGAEAPRARPGADADALLADLSGEEAEGVGAWGELEGERDQQVAAWLEAERAQGQQSDESGLALQVLEVGERVAKGELEVDDDDDDGAFEVAKAAGGHESDDGELAQKRYGDAFEVANADGQESGGGEGSEFSKTARWRGGGLRGAAPSSPGKPCNFWCVAEARGRDFGVGGEGDGAHGGARDGDDSDEEIGWIEDEGPRRDNLARPLGIQLESCAEGAARATALALLGGGMGAPRQAARDVAELEGEVLRGRARLEWGGRGRPHVRLGLSHFSMSPSMHTSTLFTGVTKSPPPMVMLEPFSSVGAAVRSPSPTVLQNRCVNLSSEDRVDCRLNLKCKLHPQDDGLVSCAADFERVALHGGCHRACNCLLPRCGHCCPLRCHPFDREHADVVCKARCNRPRPAGCNHVCRHMCKDCHGETPEDLCPTLCEEIMEVTLPCGHQQKEPCHRVQDENRLGEIDCQTIVSVELPCGHVSRVPCHLAGGHRSGVAPLACSFKEKVRAECGHQVMKHCMSLQRCNKACEKVIDVCGHPCGRKCSDSHDHASCQHPCAELLHCGHKCQERCGKQHTDLCAAPCARVCTHGHQCLNSCHERCVPCREPCKWRCIHLQCNKLCHEECDRPRCEQLCDKVLGCGHLCRGVCGEPCVRCVQCFRQEETCPLTLELLTKLPGKLYELDCGHAFDLNMLDGYMDTQQENNGHAAILAKCCPTCRKQVHKAPRYQAQIKRQLGLIDAVKEQKRREQRRLTDAERREVDLAMGGGRSGAGHWFACPNGHPYFIGECGGAMQESRCPECGARVGGGSHRLLADNSYVADFAGDGAAPPAWPGVAGA